jgi:hypothetical protein
MTPRFTRVCGINVLCWCCPQSLARSWSLFVLWSTFCGAKSWSNALGGSCVRNMGQDGKKICSSCGDSVACFGADATNPRRGLAYFQLRESDLLSLEGKGIRDEEKCLKLLEDGDLGSLALSKGLNASWWEWSQGSALFFWRWRVSQRKAAQDGMEIFVRGHLPLKLSSGRGTRQDARSLQSGKRSTRCSKGATFGVAS